MMFGSNLYISVGHTHVARNASRFIMAPCFAEKAFHIHYSHHSSSGDWQGNYSHLLVNWDPNSGLPTPSPALSPAPHYRQRTPFFVTQLSLGLSLCGSMSVLWPLQRAPPQEQRKHCPTAQAVVSNWNGCEAKVCAWGFCDSRVPDPEGQDPSVMIYA